MDTTTAQTTSMQQTKPAQTPARRQTPAPLYHVVLFDDDDHTYEYVIGMLRKLFGFSQEESYELAHEVDTTGRVILTTTTREHAELKRDQVHSFGRDYRLARCQGSMTCTIEPAN